MIKENSQYDGIKEVVYLSTKDISGGFSVYL